MLPSEELLNKYRTAEKSGATEPAPEKAEVEAGSEPAKTSAEPAQEPQHATEGEGEGVGTTQKTPANPEKGDSRARQQHEFEKRLARQQRSHQAQMAQQKAEFERQIAELRAKLPAEPELKPEDFQSRSEYDAYKQKQMEDSVVARLKKDQADKEAKDAADAQQAEKAQQKLQRTFGTPEAIQDFQDTMGEFVDREQEFLATEKGELYQEFIDESPLGLIIAKIIAKSPKAIEGLKRWSPTMMMDELHRFEDSLTERIKASQKQMEAKSAAAKEEPAAQQTKPTMPSTGAIGKTSASSGKFDAKEYLRQKYPERYGRR